MAAFSLYYRGLTTLSKYPGNHNIRSTLAATGVSFCLRCIGRREFHETMKDKNDDNMKAKARDEVEGESEYWEPDPQTGVFGPASEISEDTTGLHSSANATQDSVLEQKTFFRPNEDLDKPVDPFDTCSSQSDSLNQSNLPH